MDLPFNPDVLLLGKFPKEPKTLISKNINTPIFIAALFAIAKIWKQPKCSSEPEVRKKIPFDIATRKINYLGINLTKEVKTCTQKTTQH